jgi:hypothetical protein
MIHLLRFVLDLGQVAATRKRVSPRVNTPKARRARMATVTRGARPAGVTPEAWAFIQKITPER